MRFMLRTLKIALLSVTLLACSPAAELIERNERTSSRVQAAAVSTNGQYSVVSTTEEGLRLFDTLTGELLHNWQQEDGGISQIVALKFSDDSNVVLAASRMTLVLWDTQSGEVLGAWRNDESFILDVAVSNNGQHIVLARNDGTVIFFEPNTGRRIEFQAHSDKVTQVEISANGQYVFSGGNDHQAILWRTEPVQITHSFPIEGRITQLAIDSFGRYGLVSSATQAYIHNLVTGEMVTTLSIKAQQKVFSSAVFSTDGKWLLTGTPSRLIELWSVKNGHRACTWRVNGRAGEHPPRAAIIALGFTNAQTIAIETSAGFGELWQLPAACHGPQQ
ncbi:WD40 repeat domain-containing protein [Aliidiomarina quisquiliarum]|uniref:WD40 repeat domain-containing protein n=1 Tax=Aliidiomarina quisquiliarum TaxID=2938947 RepID=UPI00208F40CA|nr:hypothetical protein [Aliidiomarina quisquiliarum]MCO4321149.1 hypothetical protein [Aliidiomarina quisquiliarum]